MLTKENNLHSHLHIYITQNADLAKQRKCLVLWHLKWVESRWGIPRSHPKPCRFPSLQAVWAPSGAIGSRVPLYIPSEVSTAISPLLYHTQKTPAAFFIGCDLLLLFYSPFQGTKSVFKAFLPCEEICHKFTYMYVFRVFWCKWCILIFEKQDT